jgi:hypothetical protein
MSEDFCVEEIMSNKNELKNHFELCGHPDCRVCQQLQLKEDGELKKRIFVPTSIVVNFPLSDEENIKVSEIQGQMVRCGVIIRDKVLDEAKKEFPQEAQFSYETNVEVVDDRYQSWFKKWFGE